jgi:hypothetical protein
LPPVSARCMTTWVKELTRAWHQQGLKVVDHTDGNFRKAIPALIWMGGLDGVSTLEFGSEEDVIREVEQIITRTNALQRGGIFIDSSSEINPTIGLDNYLAMIQACNTFRNPEFKR